MRITAGILSSALLISSLLGGPGPTAAAQAAPTMIIMRNSSYEPAYVTVEPGTRVVWVNRDQEAHTVTNDTGLFNTEVGPGERFAMTFSEPGVYFYFCLPHDWMIGEITVGQPEAGTMGYPD